MYILKTFNCDCCRCTIHTWSPSRWPWRDSSTSSTAMKPLPFCAPSSTLELFMSTAQSTHRKNPPLNRPPTLTAPATSLEPTVHQGTGQSNHRTGLWWGTPLSHPPWSSQLPTIADAMCRCQVVPRPSPMSTLPRVQLCWVKGRDRWEQLWEGGGTKRSGWRSVRTAWWQDWWREGWSSLSSHHSSSNNSSRGHHMDLHPCDCTIDRSRHAACPLLWLVSLRLHLSLSVCGPFFLVSWFWILYLHLSSASLCPTLPDELVSNSLSASQSVSLRPILPGELVFNSLSASQSVSSPFCLESWFWILCLHLSLSVSSPFCLVTWFWTLSKSHSVLVSWFWTLSKSHSVLVSWFWIFCLHLGVSVSGLFCLFSGYRERKRQTAPCYA